MFFESASGFMMPFVFEDGEEAVELLGFGEQRHPSTGKLFNHEGIDFVCPHKPLFALATGMVVGVGQDARHGQYIITKYGKFEVKYGHIDQAFVPYGTGVVSGQQIAMSGDFLHFEVRYTGEVVNPTDFLGVIFTNVSTLATMGIKSHPQLISFDVPVTTSYDADMPEITDLMLRWLPTYLNDMRQGSYLPPERMLTSLRNLLMQAGERNYFFEQMPSLGNPMGLSARSGGLAGKVQDLLIGDFLAYMASRHDTYLSSWSDEQKKNFLPRPPRTE